MRFIDFLVNTNYCCNLYDNKDHENNDYESDQISKARSYHESFPRMSIYSSIPPPMSIYGVEG